MKPLTRAIALVLQALFDEVYGRRLQSPIIQWHLEELFGENNCASGCSCTSAARTVVVTISAGDDQSGAD